MIKRMIISTIIIFSVSIMIVFIFDSFRTKIESDSLQKSKAVTAQELLLEQQKMELHELKEKIARLEQGQASIKAQSSGNDAETNETKSNAERFDQLIVDALKKADREIEQNDLRASTLQELKNLYSISDLSDEQNANLLARKRIYTRFLSQNLPVKKISSKLNTEWETTASALRAAVNRYLTTGTFDSDLQQELLDSIELLQNKDIRAQNAQELDEMNRDLAEFYFRYAMNRINRLITDDQHNETLNELTWLLAENNTKNKHFTQNEKDEINALRQEVLSTNQPTPERNEKETPNDSLVDQKVNLEPVEMRQDSLSSAKKNGKEKEGKTNPKNTSMAIVLANTYLYAKPDTLSQITVNLMTGDRVECLNNSDLNDETLINTGGFPGNWVEVRKDEQVGYVLMNKIQLE